MTGPLPVRPARTAAARVVLFWLLTWIAGTGLATAQVTNVEGVEAPIVRVNIRQGDVTIRTWDRPTVSVDGDPSLVVQRKSTMQNGEPYSLPVPPAQSTSPEGAVALPAESFVVSSIPAGQREAIFIRNPPDTGPGGPPTSVTVTIPNASVFVFAHTNNGTVDVHDYRGGTLYATAARGRVSLANVGGAVFAQSTHGPLVVSDSSFDRIRARSLTGNVTFERTRARQIEATSVNGSIVYDGGAFEPGLARFESTRGDIAIGATGGAQIGAHAANGGRVFTNFDHAVRVEGHDGGTNAIVGGGGPVVTANSQGGNVYLYDGSLRGRSQLPAEWDAPIGALQRPAERGHAEPRPIPQARAPYASPGPRAGKFWRPRHAGGGRNR